MTRVPKIPPASAAPAEVGERDSQASALLWSATLEGAGHATLTTDARGVITGFNPAAERLTVYITAALPGGAEAYEFVTRNGLDAFYWANGTITCTVVGDLPDGGMQTVARKVYQQLTWHPDEHGT